MSGSFVLGILLVLLLERFPPNRYARPFLATGFLGAYTTFSTFSVETDLLVRDGHVGVAVLYVAASLVAGLTAAWLGIEPRRPSPQPAATSRKASRMKLEGHQKRLTIFVGESDHVGRHSLATEIVQRAHAAGLAGASMFRGVEGYGASNHLHTTRILSLSDDLPIAIVIVDTDERPRLPAGPRRAHHRGARGRRRRRGGQVRRPAGHA